MKDNSTATWQDLARQEILLWGLGIGSFQYLNVFDRCAPNLSKILASKREVDGSLAYNPRELHTDTLGILDGSWQLGSEV